MECMEQTTALTDGKGWSRRRFIGWGAMGLAGWLLSPGGAAAAVIEDDLTLVSHLAQMDEREAPLMVLRDFENDPDGEVSRHIRRTLRQREALLAAVRKKIGLEEKIYLSLEAIEVRLLFVPQLRQPSSAAYRRYCVDVTDFLFGMSRTDNFYSAITSPRRDLPVIASQGISAFLVHRLAKGYRAICRFRTASGKHVKYRVSGSFFSNHLGAVDLEIEVLAEGSFGLHRRPFTVWQNNGAAFRTLMAVPVEETLHYYLGTATDRQIAKTLRHSEPESLADAQHLASEWMAVEESIVGGLVDRVLDRYCRRYQLALPANSGTHGKAPSPALPQYRYRRQGRHLVHQLGFHDAVAMYMDDPSAFRKRLMLGVRA